MSKAVYSCIGETIGYGMAGHGLVMVCEMTRDVRSYAGLLMCNIRVVWKALLYLPILLPWYVFWTQVPTRPLRLRQHEHH